MSDMTTPLPQFLPATDARPQRRALSSRPLKLGVAAVAALVGGYGVLVDRQYVSTSHAVVSSYVLEVRTPIQGIVNDVPSTAGDVVQQGALLARVGDVLTDHQHLDNLEITAEAAQSNAESLQKERTALEAMRQKLFTRAQVHNAAVRERLGEQVEEAKETLTAQEASLNEASKELERGKQLASSGVISRAALDKLAAAQTALTHEVKAQEATYAVLQTELRSAGQGVLAEPGVNQDVTYSAQRADEVSIALAGNARALDAARAQAKEAHHAAEAELQRASLLGASSVRAPSSGVIWKLNAINGEHVEADSSLVSLVDCNRQFVLADVPQERLSTILLGGRAEVKLAGESEQRSGTVMTVSGASQTSALDAKLAALPVRNSADEIATVVIRLDQSNVSRSGSPCLVGRTARVRIPTEATNLLSLWLAKRM